jgi:hypothetical protein
LRCLLAPPLPKPLPPLPLPDIVNMYYLFFNDDLNGRFRFVFRVFSCFFACFVGVTSQFCYKECI